MRNTKIRSKEIDKSIRLVTALIAKENYRPLSENPCNTTIVDVLLCNYLESSCDKVLAGVCSQFFIENCGKLGTFRKLLHFYQSVQWLLHVHM